MAAKKNVKAGERPTLSMIVRAVGPFRRRAAFVLGLVLADNILASFGIGMILPVFQTMLDPTSGSKWIGRLFPSFAEIPSQKRVVIVTSFALALFFVRFCVGIVKTGAVRDAAERLRLYWSRKIGRNILFGSYQRFIGKNQGVWLNDWLTEPLCSSRFYLNYMQYISSLTMAVVLFILGVVVNWKVMVGFIALMGLLLLVIRKYTYGAAVDHSRNKSHLNQQLSASISESLSHIKDVKILNAETSRLEQMAAVLERIRGIFVKAEIYGELPRLAGELLSISAIVLVAVAMTFMPDVQMADILPMLAFFFVTVYRLMTSATAAMTARIKAWQEFHSVSLVHAMAEEEWPEAKGGEPIEGLTTDVAFEGVSFAYEEGRKIMDAVRFALPRGKFIVLAGKSGAGKTTLLDLLLRFVQPQAGKIAANGRPIDAYNLYDWRRLFGYVSQDAALFYGSIRENIAIGLPSPTEEELDEVCRMAGCFDFIKGLEKGYDTMVGERGYALSGGQRKRIAIARALIRKPSFLILDEATTSFETNIEKEILLSLRASFPDLGIILVSHRPGLVAQADLILTLEEGRLKIVEGKHAQA